MWKQLTVTAIVALFACSHTSRVSMGRSERSLSAFTVEVLTLEFSIRHALRPSAPTDAALDTLATRVGVQLNTDLAGVSDEALAKEIWGRIGKDHRREIETVSDKKIRENGQAVCAIVEADLLDSVDGYWVAGEIKTLTQDGRLCPWQPFGDQPLLAYGTGFLVGDSVVATAGHVLRGLKLDVASFFVVFGFETRDKVAKPEFPASQVFRAVEIVACKWDSVADWALLRLDRSPGRTPLVLNCSNECEVGDSLYLIGHGEGLPLKYSNGAVVTERRHERYFNGNVDAFNHDSGAPVFNDSHYVEGIAAHAMNMYVDVRGGPCTEKSFCCLPYMFGNNPEVHTTIVPVSEFARWVDPDSCSYRPPESADCGTWPEFSFTIILEAPYAIIRLGYGPSQLLTFGTPIDPIPVWPGLTSAKVLICDENGCRWEQHRVRAGRRYSIKEASYAVEPTKRWLNVTFTEVEDDR